MPTATGSCCRTARGADRRARVNRYAPAGRRRERHTRRADAARALPATQDGRNHARADAACRAAASRSVIAGWCRPSTRRSRRPRSGRTRRPMRRRPLRQRSHAPGVTRLPPHDLDARRHRMRCTRFVRQAAHPDQHRVGTALDGPRAETVCLEMRVEARDDVARLVNGHRAAREPCGHVRILMHRRQRARIRRPPATQRQALGFKLRRCGHGAMDRSGGVTRAPSQT